MLENFSKKDSLTPIVLLLLGQTKAPCASVMWYASPLAFCVLGPDCVMQTYPVSKLRRQGQKLKSQTPPPVFNLSGRDSLKVEQMGDILTFAKESDVEKTGED